MLPRRLLTLLCALIAATAAAGHGTATQPLPFSYDLYAFRGAGDSTAVVATFAVPAGHLERESYEGGTRYRFDVTLVLADTATPADKGKVRALPSAAGTYRGLALAEEAGVDGQLVLARPAMLGGIVVTE